jgi:hypothetical protein
MCTTIHKITNRLTTYLEAVISDKRGTDKILILKIAIPKSNRYQKTYKYKQR